MVHVVLKTKTEIFLSRSTVDALLVHNVRFTGKHVTGKRCNFNQMNEFCISQGNMRIFLRSVRCGR